MRKTNRKLFMTAVALLLTVMMVLAMPTTAAAATEVMRPTSIDVVAHGITIDPNKIESEETVFEMEVWARGGYFSSYELNFRMPDFVQVKEVVPNPELSETENATFNTYTENDTRVNVVYSSPNNVAGVRLFTVYFTVTDYNPAYCAVECVKAQFVDADYNVPFVNADLGFVQIGNTSFAKMGDVNGDGEVTLADLLIIQRSMVNPNYPLNGDQFAVADIDKNGELTILDCQYIQNYLIGRLDSLENIGGTIDPSLKMYTLTIEISNQEGMTMYAVAHTVKEGQTYSEILLPICEMLDAQYDIKGVDYVYSNVYGEIAENFNLDDLKAVADDHLKVVAVTDGKLEKEVRYTYANVMKQPNGSVMRLDYAFYADGTALFKMEMQQNGEIVDNAEQWVNWYQDGEFIVVEIPEMGPQKMFVVNKDNTLSPYDGGHDEPMPDEDHILSSDYKGRVGVVVGSDPSVLVKNACQQTMTFVFSQSGEHVVQITPDMLDYSAVNFNEIGEYDLIVNVSVNGREMTMYFTAYVIEDMNGIEILGTYVTDDTVSEIAWIDTITVFANGKVMADDYYVASYELLKDNVIAFDLEGADIVLALDSASKTASFYLPEEKEIGTYVYNDESGRYKLYFAVYGDYTGAGNYVAVYSMEMDGLVMWATSRVYLDLENRTLRHAGAPCTNTTIDENNNLIANHNFVEMVEKEPTCTEYGGAYIRCEYCGEYQGRVQLPMLGHQYEDGYCVNCGRSEKEDEMLENYKQQALNEMMNEWANLQKEFGDLSKYQGQYDKYYNAIANATAMYIVEEYRNYFQNLVSKIRGNGGYVEPDYIVNVEYNREIRVMAGIDHDEFTEKYYPQTVTVYFNSGKTCEVLLTPGMVTSTSVNLNEPGRYDIGVEVWVDGKSTMLWIDVYVLVNKSDVECLGSYQIVSDVDIHMYTIDLYADKTLVIDGYFATPYETIQENVICFPIEGGGDLVMVLDPESLTAQFYVPADEVIGTYTYVSEYGSTTIFTVYGKYNGAGDYIAVYAMIQGDLQMSVTTRAYLDLENRVLRHVGGPCFNMLIDDSNNLSVNHLVKIETQAPTCTEYGWECHRCEYCDRMIYEVQIDKLEHQYNEEGYCANCGRSEKEYEELEKYKQQALNEMRNEWANLQNEFGDLSKYQDRYNSYYNDIFNATEMYQVDDCMNWFRDMVNEIRNNGGGMAVVPMEWWLENGYDAATQGESIEAYIERYFVNNYLVVRMSDGSTVRIQLDRSMITGINGDFSMPGQVEFVIGASVPGAMNGMQMSFFIEHIACVTVQPDPTKLQLIGSYRFTDQNDIGWNQIDLYEGGVLAVNGMFYLYTQLNDNLIEFNYMSAVLLTLDHENKTACYYKPTEPMLGTYTLYEGDNVSIFTVYGEYCGAGDYITVLEVKLGDGTGNIKQTRTITTKVMLNLENSTLYYSPYGNMMFDSEGILSRYIYIEPEFPPVMDFEQYQDQIKDEIKMMWSEIDQGDYEVTQEQYEQYHSIMDRVYQVTEIWELDELRREAEKLCNAIKGIVELEWTSVTGMPHTVLVGTTMEQFYEMLSQVKVRMVYTDGSEVYASVSLDSFNLENLNLNVAGEYEISYSYTIEGQDYAMNCVTWIDVIENMGEGEGVEYAYITRIEGAYNGMEWTSITLYENGYALIRDDSYFYFVEYMEEDGLILFNFMDMVIGVLEYVTDETGKVMGVAYYRPETEQIYIYDDQEDMYFALEVFQLNGKYFAFFEVREYNRDGSQDVYEMTCDIIFNEEGNKIFALPLEGWFEITEGNVLVPSECDEHVFDENGRCEYCGMRVNNGNEGGEDFGGGAIVGGGSVSNGEIVEKDFATGEELENMQGGNATANP